MDNIQNIIKVYEGKIKMPVYPQDTEDYPPILICTDKGKVFLVSPERDQKMGICYTIHYSDI